MKKKRTIFEPDASSAFFLHLDASDRTLNLRLSIPNLTCNLRSTCGRPRGSWSPLSTCQKSESSSRKFSALSPDLAAQPDQWRREGKGRRSSPHTRGCATSAFLSPARLRTVFMLWCFQLLLTGHRRLDDRRSSTVSYPRFDGDGDGGINGSEIS